MQVTCLLGPAGSGKTHRCLREIRAALQASPEGGALVFLAPKQATFQLERELLAEPGLPGFTRLRIVAFDTLAELVLEEFSSCRTQLLREEGRVMVLRALLTRRYAELRLFQTTARLPGFARQLSVVLEELQRHQVLPEHLRRLASETADTAQLPEKLHDLALLFEAYLDWLQTNRLLDPNRLLELAAEQVRQARQAGKFRLDGLWLDGFSELSIQELDLLAELVTAGEGATLAFCLDEPPAAQGAAMWSLVRQTFHRTCKRLAEVPGCKLAVLPLERRPGEHRFAHSPVLAHLEAHWAEPEPFVSPELKAEPRVGRASRPGEPEIETNGSPDRLAGTARPTFTGVQGSSDLVDSALRTYQCANPEVEAVAAAREILREVRERGARFRDLAVLVRSLEDYHPVVRRVFSRYQIPFFLDRREPLAHHPLAELTRYALRVAALAWELEDWLGALKTGLVHPEAAALDELENAALARGWHGAVWQHPISLPNRPELERRLERLREKIVPPFSRLGKALDAADRQPTGADLAAALRALWEDLGVPERLAQWSREAERLGAEAGPALHQAQIHRAAWEQLSRWLEDLELAFAATPLPLGDWLPVVEAGLSNLTAGVIPLALDEVLVGAVDRSRNPDLTTVLVLGVNETVFPQAPARTVLLTEPDREALRTLGLPLDPSQADQVAQEGYLGYIACTRARRRLVLTYALRNAADARLNPSAFIDQVQRLFPGLEAAPVPAEDDWRRSAHAAELVAPLLRNRRRAAPAVVQSLAELERLTLFRPVLARWLQVSGAQALTRLAPGRAREVYGPALETSISHLEDYAACPFKFFVGRGLRAEERPEFEVDIRERGSLQHEALMLFHRRVREQQQRWRELSPEGARELIREIGERLCATFRDGLFAGSPDRRFLAGALNRRLQQFIEVSVHWARQYAFDPWQVELGFGLGNDELPAWSLELGAGRALRLRGRIDRVDVLPGDPDQAYLVVIDYKLGGQELTKVKLANGLDLQLLAYLGVLQETPNARQLFGAVKLVPAGAFYVSLLPRGGTAKHRRELLEAREAARRRGYQHRGRFRRDLLVQFDNRQEAQGDQFRYAVKKDGAFAESRNEALPPEDFLELVAHTRQRLVQYGQEIFEGNVAIAPYRIQAETACARCLYRAICRFDSWTTGYRTLKCP